MQSPTFADIVAAAPVVRRYLKPTPLYEWPALSALLGCRYFLKHENHTPTTVRSLTTSTVSLPSSEINWARMALSPRPPRWTAGDPTHVTPIL